MAAQLTSTNSSSPIVLFSCYSPRDYFLPRPCFAKNQDRDFLISDNPGDEVEYFLDRRTGTDDTTKIRHVYQGIDVAWETQGEKSLRECHVKY
jgi:hypothetical protein